MKQDPERYLDMATYRIFRETATNTGLHIEGITFSGTQEGLLKRTNEYLAENQPNGRKAFAVIAFDKLHTRVIVLTKNERVILPPTKDILASLLSEYEYAAKAEWSFPANEDTQPGFTLPVEAQ